MPRLRAQTPEEKARYRTGQTNDAGQIICGAKNRAGRPCASTRVMRNGRCRMHGGKSLGGIASPSWKDGRYSMYLPQRMLPDYQAALADTELLAMRKDIALVEARVADLLRRVDTGEAGGLWRSLGAHLDTFEAAQAARDATAAASALRELSGLIRRGQGDWGAWGEIGGLLEQRRRLIESEQKRLVAMQQMISTERAMNLIGSVGAIIREHIKDRNVLNAISDDISRVLGSGTPAPDSTPAGE